MERIKFKSETTNNEGSTKVHKERDPNRERPKRFFKDVILNKFAFGDQEIKTDEINK
jgi:hypothetical protein